MITSRAGRRRMAVWSIGIGLLLGAGAACAERTPGDASPAVSDATPLVRRWEIGSIDEPRTLFTRPIVRALPDGRVLIADPGPMELRVFDADGQFVSAMAIGGDGPGEVRAPFRIALLADTVFLIGEGIGRRPVGWVVLSTQAKGTIVPGREQAGDGPRFSVLDRLSSGAWLVREGAVWQTVNTLPPAGTLIPDSLTIGVLPGTPAPIVWLPRMPSGARVTFEWPDSPAPVAFGEYVPAHSTLFAVSDDALWMVDSRTGMSQRWRHGIDRVDIPLQLGEPAPFDIAAIETVRRRLVAAAGTPLERNRIAATYDPALLPSTAPLTTAIVPAPGQRLWLERFHEDPAAPRTYTVVDSSGHALGTYRTPAGVRVQAVGHRLVLATRTDEQGVPYVIAFDVPMP